MKSVVVIILSWNKPRAVIACIDRVKAQTGTNVQVVVVDNASQDGSADAIGSAHPDVTVLRETTNRGFAGGVNRGLAEAERRGSDYAWLLNDDTSFDGSIVAPLLAAAADRPECGLLTPVLRDLGPDGGVQFANGLVDWSRGSMGHNFTEAVYRARRASGATAIVPGTAMLIDLRVHRTIGPFDERFFAYWEDTDYAVRAARAGFGSEVVAGATIAHAAPHTTHRPPYYHYYMTRNEGLFWRLHAPAGTPWRRRWLSAALEAIGRERDLGHADNAAAIVDGLWHLATGRYGARAAHSPAPRWLARVATAAPYLVASVVQGHLWRVVTRVVHGR